MKRKRLILLFVLAAGAVGFWLYTKSKGTGQKTTGASGSGSAPSNFSPVNPNTPVNPPSSTWDDKVNGLANVIAGVSPAISRGVSDWQKTFSVVPTTTTKTNKTLLPIKGNLT
jgi:hypothetical protein